MFARLSSVRVLSCSRHVFVEEANIVMTPQAAHLLLINRACVALQKPDPERGKLQNDDRIKGLDDLYRILMSQTALALAIVYYISKDSS